jgi:hypothetical protein
VIRFVLSLWFVVLNANANAAELGVGVGVGVPWQGSNLSMSGSLTLALETGVEGLSVVTDVSAYQVVTSESVVMNDPIGGPVEIQVGYQTSVLPFSFGPQYSWNFSPRVEGLAMLGAVVGTAKRTGGQETLSRGYGIGFLGRVGASIPYEKVCLLGSLDLMRLGMSVGGEDLFGNEIHEQLGAIRAVVTVVMPLGGGEIE